ncbi:hypothetical protein BDA99DRAFT_596775 [Phascolomyces articulosus]|uniref:Uncharacterized protein n=1 Tax=Phascolomyces articulosus TaxID=60185 RepID=A0AAD5KEJ1_9FUNG|nr:hypothetical protein BDA99DRAFT_596775 [Phascolomyces articulosus]
MAFPILIVICIVAAVAALLLSGLGFYLIKKRRRSSPSTVDIAQDEKMNYQQQLQQRSTTGQENYNNAPTMRSTVANNQQPSFTPPPMTDQQQQTVDEIEEEEPKVPKARKMSRAERKQHQDNVKINLPLPPPSTSLFSDKMELSSEEAMELFDKYMNINKDTSDAEKPSFYSSVQRKAGTIRSTVRQSLRRQKSTKSSTPLNQLFTGDQQQQQPQPQSSTSSSAISTDAHSNMIGRSSSSLPSTPQTPVHAIKPPSPTIPPVVHQQQQQQQSYYHHNNNNTNTEEEEEEVKISQAIEEAAAAAYSDGKNNNASMRAARRVIRTASRKSKTRSMLVNEEDVMKMFTPSSSNAEQQQTPSSGYHHRDNNNRPAVANFASVREKPMTGSVRRFVRDSIVTDKSATVSAVSATKGSGSASTTATAREIAEWWSPEDTNKPAKVEANNSTATNNTTNNKIPPPPRMPGKLVDGEQKGNVDTIRRMLQASMTESGSMLSISTNQGRFSSEGPDPVASFSSSTVRTMIPENDQQQQQPHRQQQQQQPQSFGAASEKIEIDGTNFALLQQNGHQTWNGRTNRVSNRPSVLPQQQQQQSTKKQSHVDENKSFFNTVNLGRRQSAKRKVMPWMDDQGNHDDNSKRTPAQRERDHYLQSLYDQA